MKFRTHECREFSDTVCANCTKCDFAVQWESQSCQEVSDTQCLPISFLRLCEVGQYAGNHSRYKDSQCLPCQYKDEPYAGLRMHVPVTSGSYNDPYSCSIKCLSYSRLRNVSNPVLGCRSCETGNVLFKQFSQAEDDSVCQFECLPGYVKVSKGAELDGGDCEAGPLPAGVQNYWSHTANVTHVQRVRASTSVQDGTAAFKFTVSHTNHGHFVVLAGCAYASSL